MPALAEVYRRFSESVAATSPLYERVALALSASEEALGAIAAAPSRQRNPAVILAALHDLALAGRAPDLAAAYAARDGDAAARRGPTRPAATPCCTRPWPRRRAGWARARSG
jgi:hypothetical protein